MVNETEIKVLLEERLRELTERVVEIDDDLHEHEEDDFGDRAIETAGDRIQTAFDLRFADILHDDFESRGRAYLHDAVTHGSGANHADCFDVHICFIRIFK